MTSISIYHYVYRITNKLTGMHYYGVRSSKVPPKLDLGIKYFSSSTDTQFKKEQLSTPDNFLYKIIKTFSTRKAAMEFEIKLHEKFDVGVNINFYNRAKATSSGFGLTGIKFSEDHKNKLAQSNFNTTIYTFYNVDGAVFVGTARDFRKKFNISQPNSNKLVNGNRNYVNGWALDKNQVRILTYMFRHKDGLVFTGTQNEFRKAFSLSSGNVSQLVNGKRSSVNGWSLILQT